MGRVSLSTKDLSRLIDESAKESKSELADSIEHEWYAHWSGEDLNEMELLGRIVDFIRGKK